MRAYSVVPLMSLTLRSAVLWGQEAHSRDIAIDQERVLGFNDLDGRIRHIAEPIGPGVLTVERRSAAAPGYIVELDVQEAFAVFVDAGDGEQGAVRGVHR